MGVTPSATWASASNLLSYGNGGTGGGGGSGRRGGTNDGGPGSSGLASTQNW